MDKASRWLRKSSDGSLSAYNERFDECYHSLKDGALNETLYKHIYPSLEHIRSSFIALPNPLYVLDICFGLGYNSLSLLAVLQKMGYKGRVKIYSPEQDETLFSTLRNFPYPDCIALYDKEIQQILYFFESAACNTMNSYELVLESMIYEIFIYKGDAMDILDSLPSNAFHIIYQDAFSPKKNPSLWSYEYFLILYRLLHLHGIITTYSQSSVVRKNAHLAKFKVYSYDSGIVRCGSVMGKMPLNIKGLRELA